jgi:hypothetical protein
VVAAAALRSDETYVRLLPEFCSLFEIFSSLDA